MNPQTGDKPSPTTTEASAFLEATVSAEALAAFTATRRDAQGNPSVLFFAATSVVLRYFRAAPDAPASEDAIEVWEVIDGVAHLSRPTRDQRGRRQATLLLDRTRAQLSGSYLSWPVAGVSVAQLVALAGAAGDEFVRQVQADSADGLIRRWKAQRLGHDIRNDRPGNVAFWPVPGQELNRLWAKPVPTAALAEGVRKLGGSWRGEVTVSCWRAAGTTVDRYEATQHSEGVTWLCPGFAREDGHWCFRLVAVGPKGGKRYVVVTLAALVNLAALGESIPAAGWEAAVGLLGLPAFQRVQPRWR